LQAYLGEILVKLGRGGGLVCPGNLIVMAPLHSRIKQDMLGYL
jgi:hypothetical protein